MENKPAKLTQSERFTNMIVTEFTSNSGGIEKSNLTNFHKRLIQNYFIQIDGVLKKSEIARLKKTGKYQDKVSLKWENVNMTELALNVVAAARVGLDPAQNNHINMIPFKNNSTSKYDIVFIPGYRGIELKTKKYGIDIPDDIIVELVYKNDEFKQIKKDKDNKIETYTFKVIADFNRGEIIGGFYYYSYYTKPEKNRLKLFTLKDIEKRKPQYASAEFWGGEKDKWVYDKEKGKNVKKGKEKVEGWLDEMCWKTIYRAAYNSITIDSQKIDDDYFKISENENRTIEDKNNLSSEEEIKPNTENITFEDAEVVTEEIKAVETKIPEKPKDEVKQPDNSKQDPKDIELQFGQ